MPKKVTIIGAGVAGLEAASSLANKGFDVVLVEQSDVTGGNVRNWDRIFPKQRKASEVLTLLQTKYSNNVKLHINTTVASYKKDKKKHIVKLSNGEELDTDAILLSTGFQVFDAHRKEEYGYGIYDGVITSADLEKTMAQGKKVLTPKGEKPRRVAFVHCVGSRDEKVGNTYCSKLCCVTAVKQAIEIKEMYPGCEAFCLYMDLRMYDRYFEDMYRRAQEKFGVTFIRGRLSEVAETIDNRLLIKTEDTLLGKPIKFSVDLLVLMAGMEPCKQSAGLSEMLGIYKGDDGFFTPDDENVHFNITNREGIFLAGTCKGPKSISETIADAQSAVNAITVFLNQKN